MMTMRIKAEVIGDSLLAALGITTALDPSVVPVFYESIEWHSLIAVLGFIATTMVIRHAYYATKRLKLDIDKFESKANDKTGE